MTHRSCPLISNQSLLLWISSLANILFEIVVFLINFTWNLFFYFINIKIWRLENFVLNVWSLLDGLILMVVELLKQFFISVFFVRLILLRTCIFIKLILNANLLIFCQRLFFPLNFKIHFKVSIYIFYLIMIFREIRKGRNWIYQICILLIGNVIVMFGHLLFNLAFIWCRFF